MKVEGLPKEFENEGYDKEGFDCQEQQNEDALKQEKEKPKEKTNE